MCTIGQKMERLIKCFKVYRSLKKGGILGVVEHRAMENTSLEAN